MASVNQKHFKAGGGNAAVKKLLAAQAGAARQLTGASQSGQQTAKPTEAQLARLRAKVAARGKAELDRQQSATTRKERSETTYSGNKVYRNGKHIGNMVNGKLVKLGANTNNTRSKDSKGDTYIVGGITYSRKTGRPIKVPENRQPVQAQDRTKKKPESEVRTITDRNRGGGGDRTPDRTPPRNNSAPTPPRRSAATRGYTMKTDLSKLLKDKPKTESPKPKPKSRLEKALAWASDKKNKDAWKKK